MRTRAIPERLRGAFTTRRYTNPRLPLPIPSSITYWRGHFMACGKEGRKKRRKEREELKRKRMKGRTTKGRKDPTKYTLFLRRWLWIAILSRPGPRATHICIGILALCFVSVHVRWQGQPQICINILQMPYLLFNMYHLM